VAFFFLTPMNLIPDKKDLHKIGYFSKLHGFKGELTAALDTDDIHDYESLEAIYLEVNGQIIPYFISLIEYKTNTSAKVKLEGIDDEAQAKALVKSSIYINKSDMSSSDSEKASLRVIEGYTVIDSEHGNIGVVDRIEELSNNPLLVVMYGKIEILLPLNSNFIDSTDEQLKVVHITAPGGLIDFYLNS
jgi:16S rRNA processing protein RimM